MQAFPKRTAPRVPERLIIRRRSASYLQPGNRSCGHSVSLKVGPVGLSRPDSEQRRLRFRNWCAVSKLPIHSAPFGPTTPREVRAPRKSKSFAVTVVALSLVAGSCGGGDRSDVSAAPVVEQISALSESASYDQPLYASPVEATPLTNFVVDGEPVGSASDLLVVGTVRTVNAGQGYSWPGGPQVEGEDSTRVVHDFNSSEAWISTIHLVVDVETSLHTETRYADRSEVTVGLALLSPVNKELEGRTIVAALHSNEKTVFDLEDGVFGVLRDGQLLGFVDDEGNVTFPALELDQDLGRATASTVRLADILDPPSVVSLRTVDGVFEAAQG